MTNLQKYINENIDSLTSESVSENDIENIIGEQIRRKRHILKMSQFELSSKCGIQQSNISNIERGNVNMTLSQLKKICNALELKISIRLE